MRQASVRAIQAVVRALPDGACADHHETIDRVKSLGRRDAIDAELAVQVQALWREMPITDAVVQTVDAQTAAAAGYFVPRLAALASDKFVPEVARSGRREGARDEGRARGGDGAGGADPEL